MRKRCVFRRGGELKVMGGGEGPGQVGAGKGLKGVGFAGLSDPWPEAGLFCDVAF